MRLSAVLGFARHFGALHTAFFHNADAGDIIFKRACDYFRKAFREKRLYDRGESLGGVALIVVVGMQSVAHLDAFVVDLAVVDKTDQLAVKKNAEKVSVLSLGNIAQILKQLDFGFSRLKIGDPVGRRHDFIFQD